MRVDVTDEWACVLRRRRHKASRLSSCVENAAHVLDANLRSVFPREQVTSSII